VTIVTLCSAGAPNEAEARRHPAVDHPPVTRPSHRQFLALANRALNRRQDGRAISFYRPIIWTVVLALLSWFSGAPGVAQAIPKEQVQSPDERVQEIKSDSKEQMQSLDEQVQEIKSDVLSMAAELSRLEERLLHPSNTQVALFVSLAEGETFRLDSVQIQIDGEPVAHHIYSFKELEALKKGGVQRIYTGNIPTGEHQLEVSVFGQLPGGRDVSGTESFGFSKDVEPKLVGITLAGRDSGDASIQLGGW
jgi:hypothetical protein